MKNQILFCFIVSVLILTVSVLPVMGQEVGDIITFGRYEQDEQPGADPIEWQVLAVENSRALLISRYGLDTIPYHSIDIDITWENCDLRKWLNEDFYEIAFDPSEKARIAETVNSNPDNPSYGTSGGNDTNDKVFLLSIDEAYLYLKKEGRQCKATYVSGQNKALSVDKENGNSAWWLRSPGIQSVAAATVKHNGDVASYGNFVHGDTVYMTTTNLVRPALWLDLTDTDTAAEQTTPAVAVPLPDDTASMSVGNLYTFGNCEQDEQPGADPIEWQVLAVENSRALLISRYALAVKQYHKSWDKCTWEKSELRKWLNKDFYDSIFSKSEKSKVMEVLNTNKDSQYAEGGKDTKDRIFLLSVDEADQYFENDGSRACQAVYTVRQNRAYKDTSNGNTAWWLRSPGGNKGFAASVDNFGCVNPEGYSATAEIAVRPALWINLK